MVHIAVNALNHHIIFAYYARLQLNILQLYQGWVKICDYNNDYKMHHLTSLFLRLGTDNVIYLTPTVVNTYKGL